MPPEEKGQPEHTVLSDEQVERLVEHAIAERIPRRRTLMLDDADLRRAAIQALTPGEGQKEVALAEVARILEIPSSNLRDLISKVTGRTPGNGGLQIFKGVLERLEKMKGSGA